jgi:DNA/RNA endonuclease YhcR with UshA esterase domain
MVAVESARMRQRARVEGIISSIVDRPLAEAPTLVADLTDDTGTIELVWMGRRSIAGVDVGRRIVAEGMVTQRGGRKAIFNPDYQLITRGGQ